MDKLQAVDEKFSDIRKIITINLNINIRIGYLIIMLLIRYNLLI